jgi:hypothetical protein
MEKFEVLCKIRNFMELEFLRKLHKLNSSNLIWKTEGSYPLELVKVTKFNNSHFEISEYNSCNVGVLEYLLNFLKKYKNVISLYQVEYIHLFLNMYDVISVTDDKELLTNCLSILNQIYKNKLKDNNLSDLDMDNFNKYKDGYIYDLNTSSFYKIININSIEKTVDYLIRHCKQNGVISTKSRFIEVRMEDLTYVGNNIFVEELDLNRDDKY